MIRSLLKIVKSSQVVTHGQPVYIDNTVNISPPPEPEAELVCGSDEEADEAARIKRERIERERLEAQRKAEEEERIQEYIRTEVENRVASQHAGIQHSKEEILSAAHNAKFDILSEASAEADAILEKARTDAEDILKKALEDGHAQGFKTGMDEATAQCEKYVQASAQFLSGINARKEAYFISHEEELKGTVMDMVKKITLGELKTDTDTIFRILRQAAKSFRNSEYLKITLSALNVEQDQISDMKFLRSVVGNIPEIEVELLPAESEMQNGTVIVDNGSEIIDASVPTQILDNGKK